MRKKAPTKAQMMQREDVINALDRISGGSFEPKYTGGDPIPDRIYEANTSLFNNSHYSESLTGFAVGYRDTTDLDAANSFYGSAVPVSRKFEYMEFDLDAAFESDANDERAIGEDFKRIKHAGKMVLGKTLNRGLMIVCDLDEVGDDPNWKERKTGQLIDRLKRNKLIRKVGLLKAAAVLTALTWNSDAGKDPDQDVIEALIAGGDDSGWMPNRVGYGHSAWAKRVRSHRAQDTAGGIASAGLTPEQVAGFLNVDEVHVTKSRYLNAGAKTQILANDVLAFTALDDMAVEDPSNIKDFVTMIDGEVYRVYEYEMGPKLVGIIVEHYSIEKITALAGIRHLQIS